MIPAPAEAARNTRSAAEQTNRKYNVNPIRIKSGWGYIFIVRHAHRGMLRLNFSQCIDTATT